MVEGNGELRFPGLPSDGVSFGILDMIVIPAKVHQCDMSV